ncbi:MAG: hypothetical protein ACAI38_07720 [Myxococcota bacterium]|nr:hypothetical protein [Myxococcota bacterium]
MSTKLHPVGHIPLTIRTASCLDQPIRTALMNENARRIRDGVRPLVNVAREGVTSLMQVGPKRAVALSRHDVYTIGDFARMNSALVPPVLAGIHAAIRAAYRE